MTCKANAAIYILRLCVSLSLDLGTWVLTIKKNHDIKFSQDIKNVIFDESLNAYNSRPYKGSCFVVRFNSIVSRLTLDWMILLPVDAQFIFIEGRTFTIKLLIMRCKCSRIFTSKLDYFLKFTTTYKKFRIPFRNDSLQMIFFNCAFSLHWLGDVWCCGSLAVRSTTVSWSKILHNSPHPSVLNVTAFICKATTTQTRSDPSQRHNWS